MTVVTELLSAFALAACGDQCSVPSTIDRQTIGPFSLTTRIEELTDNSYETERSTKHLEGDPYTLITIKLCDDASIDLTFEQDQSVPFELRTTSGYFRYANGAHVGMNLAELRALFPSGVVRRGYADGLYFVFETGAGGIFKFDAQKIGKDCVLPELKCSRSLDEEQSVEYFVR